jgi:hypothetical protein
MTYTEMYVCCTSLATAWFALKARATARRVPLAIRECESLSVAAVHGSIRSERG